MNGFTNCFCGMLSASAAMLIGASSLAQNAPQPPAGPGQPFVQAAPQRGQTVLERRRPEYDAIGIRRGPFFIYPLLELTPAYDTNVFQTRSNEKADLLLITSPEIVVRSNWRRHELNLAARADIGRFRKHSSEDYEDAEFIANGRFDIVRDAFAFGSFRWAQRHEERGSPDAVNGISPTVFWALESNGGLQRRFGRITVRLEGFYRSLNYHDVSAAGPVFLINNDDRDRQEFTGSARVAYQISERFGAFVQGSGNRVWYHHATDDAGFQRDNDGFEVVGGMSVDFTNVLFGEVFAGWRRQKYEDSRFSTISGPTAGLALTWNPTGLTTVRAAVTRAIEQTTIIGASGYFATLFELRIDHELRRNVILSGHANFQLDDYRGISRDDKWYRAGVRARWLVNRNFNLLGAYQFTRLQSDVGNQGFTRHLILLTITGQL